MLRMLVIGLVFSEASAKQPAMGKEQVFLFKDASLTSKKMPVASPPNAPKSGFLFKNTNLTSKKMPLDALITIPLIDVLRLALIVSMAIGVFVFGSLHSSEKKMDQQFEPIPFQSAGMGSSCLYEPTPAKAVGYSGVKSWTDMLAQRFL